MPVTHNAADHKFTDGQAELEYSLPTPGVIDFTHTFVPADRRDQGVGEGLAKTGLEYARKEQLRVVPTCPFVASYVKKHDEYADLLAQ